MLPPINPLQATLGFANVSFVAQTTDWNPAHLYATIRKAADHPGLAFVRIVQRCPVFMKDLYAEVSGNPDEMVLLSHEDGIDFKAKSAKFKRVVEHDPSDMFRARELAEIRDGVPVGLFYQNTNNPRYDEYGAHNMGMTMAEKAAAIDELLDTYTIRNN